MTQPPAEFPIQDLAAIGDGRTVALIDPQGTVVWWCVPNMDSSALFDRLLDPAGGGGFRLAPTTAFRMQRRYLPDSNVVQTEYVTDTGTAVVTESLNSSLAGRLPWCELARRIDCTSGLIEFAVQLGFAHRPDVASPWLQPNPNACIFHVGPILGVLHLSANVAITSQQDHAIAAAVRLAAGQQATVALLAGEDEPLGVPPIAEIDARIDMSDAAWRSWAEALQYDGPHRALVRRSALALKLLLFSPSGAIAAAATTSLPEQIGGAKNYDYRYAWMRDAAYSVNAFLRVGAMPEAKAAFTWLMHRIGRQGARVVYTMAGEIAPGLTEQPDLPGYRGSTPVVTGNAATTQHQHGIYGDIFETASLFVAGGNVLDQRSAKLLADLADQCADRWRRPDAGIWELEQDRHYTMSKVSAWQALDRAVALAQAGHLAAGCLPRWHRERDRIVAWIDDHCWSDHRQAYTMYAGSEKLDASLALAVRFRLPRPDRLALTLHAIRRDLAAGKAKDALLYRYSGAERGEGAFLACSFWHVEALATLGRVAEAEAMFAATLAGIAPGIGIVSEMVDPATGDHLGNTPQGLSHLALIHAACTIRDAIAASLPPDQPARTTERVAAAPASVSA